MAQKRRITPIMVSSEVSTAGQLPLVLQQAGHASTLPTGGIMMSQEKQAEEAAKVLGPGRHMYVELKEDYNELLKERGVRTRKTVREDGQQAGSGGALDPGADPVFKDPPRRGGGQSVLSNVIHKLEQQFVMNGPEDSDEEAEGAADKGPEEAIAGTDDDAGGDEDDQGGFNDLYDMDDEFIDDTELRDYFGSDRRKTKYSGFFVNKGEIEKTDEEIALAPDSPPKRKRRAKKPENGAAKAVIEEVAKKRMKRRRPDEAEDVDQAIAEEKESKGPEGGQPGPGLATAADRAGEQGPPQAAVSSAAFGSAPSGVGEAAGTAPISNQGAAAAGHVEAHQATTQAQALFGSEVADASLPARTRNVARKSIGGVRLQGLPGAPEDGAQDPSELNKEVLASIEKLKRTAEKQPVPDPGPAKQVPAALKPLIKSFALAVMRQTEKQTDTLKLALNAVMPVMGPYTSRQSLTARVKSEWQKTKVAADRALADLKAEIDKCLLQGGEVSATAEDDFAAALGPAKLANWTWNEQRKKLLWEAVTKAHQVKGGNIGPGRGARIYAQVADVFPANTVSKDDLRNVYNEEKEARAAQTKEGKQSSSPLHAHHSQHSSEPPLSHPGTPYPASSSAGHSSQPRPGSTSVWPASAASQEHAPVQQAPLAATGQLVPLQAPPAQHALQALPVAAAPQAAAAGGGTLEQRQPSQPSACPPRPASGGAAGVAGAPEQHMGVNGGEQHEKCLSQTPGASESGQSRRSEAEHAERLRQAVEAAASQGADKEHLQGLVSSFRRGSARAIVNEVLMHAGPDGMTIAEVIEKANGLGLTDPEWEVTSSRKSNLSSVLNSNQTAFVHVGKSKYAHAAHKGVVHVPHARRKAASSVDTSQAAAASQQDGAAAVASQPSQALPMQTPSAAPEAQALRLMLPIEPPPYRPPPVGLQQIPVGLQQIVPGGSAMVGQAPSREAADIPNP